MSGSLSFVVVGLGGGLGSALRYLTGVVSAPFADRYGTVVGTLTVNALGCLLIGFLASLIARNGSFAEYWRLFLLPGLLGGFTTYSAFAYESFSYIDKGEWGSALVYIAVTTLTGLLAVAIGAYLSNHVFSVS